MCAKTNKIKFFQIHLFWIKLNMLLRLPILTAKLCFFFRLRSLLTESKLFVCVFRICHPKNVSRTETLHTESDAYKLIHCKNNNCVGRRLPPPYQGAVGLSWAIQSLLQGFSDSVWCFASDTGATYYKEGSIQCFVMRSEVNQFVRRHSGFWRSLVQWLWIVKTPLKMPATDAKKCSKSNPIRFF